jgi:hypothetical protein
LQQETGLLRKYFAAHLGMLASTFSTASGVASSRPRPAAAFLGAGFGAALLAGRLQQRQREQVHLVSWLVEYIGSIYRAGLLHISATAIFLQVINQHKLCNCIHV